MGENPLIDKHPDCWGGGGGGREMIKIHPCTSMDLSKISTYSRGRGKTRSWWTKVQSMDTNVHPNLILVLFILHTEVECWRGILALCGRWINQHDTSVGQRKILSPQQELNPQPPEHMAGALFTELWELVESRMQDTCHIWTQLNDLALH